MRLNNNIPALNAYTNLLKTGRKIEKSMGSLSSGYRINSVADDPAGMAISVKMKDQIRRLDMASRNTMDGISLIQTADGAFQEMHNMIHRIRELAVMTSNDTNEPSDREKANEEVQQLLDELNSIAERTEFNKIKILNGDCSRLTKKDPTAYNLIKSIYVSDDFENTGTSTGLSFTVTATGTPPSFTAPPTSTPWTAATTATLTAGDILIINNDSIMYDGNAANFQNSFIDFVKSLGAEVDPATGIVYSERQGSNIAFECEGSAAMLSFFGIPAPTAPATTTTITGTDASVTATYNSAPIGVMAHGNEVVFFDTKNEQVVIKFDVNKQPPNNFTRTGANSSASANVAVLDYGQLMLQIGPNKDMALSVQIPNMSTRTLGMEFANVSGWRTSEDTIVICDEAEAFLAKIHAKLGAYQNRLEYTWKSLDVTNENTSTALSRIYDTDMALEMTRLTQQNVLSQAGLSILAQANQRPQQFLQIMG